MSKGAIRLAMVMKESVVAINNILDDFLRYPESDDIQKISKDHYRINLYLHKIYNNLLSYTKVLSDNNNIPMLERIDCTEDTRIDVIGEELFIEMCRIPKKNKADNLVVDALKNGFNKALIDGKKIPEMPRKIIEIIHVYPSDFPVETIRDNDNYYYKSIINTICYYTKGSDRGDFCWLVFGTEIAEDYFAGTRIRVYPKR